MDNHRSKLQDCLMLRQFHELKSRDRNSSICQIIFCVFLLKFSLIIFNFGMFSFLLNIFKTERDETSHFIFIVRQFSDTSKISFKERGRSEMSQPTLQIDNSSVVRSSYLTMFSGHFSIFEAIFE